METFMLNNQTTTSPDDKPKASQVKVTLDHYAITIDSIGVIALWHHVAEHESNLRWARFHGYTYTFDQIWVLERSDMPQGAVPISLDTAKRLILEAWAKRVDANSTTPQSTV